MARATDFLKRHFNMPTSKAASMTYTGGVLNSIIRSTKARIKIEKEKDNAAEPQDLN